MKNRKGFTLVELMIVISIIGILAAVVVPSFQSYKEQRHRDDIDNFVIEATQLIEESKEASKPKVSKDVINPDGTISYK